jgi:hypothetical protein
VTVIERFSDENQVLNETEALLRSLHGVWDEDAVDDLDHGLQAATRAIEDGADDGEGRRGGHEKGRHRQTGSAATRLCGLPIDAQGWSGGAD